MSNYKLTKKIFSFLLILVLLSFSVFATENYKTLGNRNNYVLGNNMFNTLLTDERTDPKTQSLTNSKQIPYIVDLDGDGTKEILIIDDTNFKIFHGLTLAPVSSHTIPNFAGSPQPNISNIVIQDLDDNGLQDIIFVRHGKVALGQGDHWIPIRVEWNGTDWNDTNVCTSISSAQPVGKLHAVLACDEDTDICNVVGDSDGGNNLDQYAFNASGCGLGHYYTYPTGLYTCFPALPSPVVYSDATKTYFVYSYLRIATGNEISKLIQLDVLHTNIGNVVNSYTTTKTLNNFEDSSTPNCGEYGNWISSPLRMDIDGFPNEEEIIFAVNYDIGDYRMYSFNDDLTDFGLTSRYPFLANGEGNIISNVIQLDGFEDVDDGLTFCVVGYDEIDEKLELLCASEMRRSYLAYESREYEFNPSSLESILPYLREEYYTLAAHATRSSTDLTDGKNLDEVLTPYGIFALDVGVNSLLTLIYSTEVGLGAYVASDMDNTGLDELFMLSQGNIWLIDDGFTFLGCGESSFGCINTDTTTIDPCLDAVVSSNTTLDLSIQLRDYANQDVQDFYLSTRAILYYGDGNSQDSNWSTWVVGGTTVPLSFELNKSITAGVLRIMSRNSYDNTSEQIIDIPFSASPNGLENGISCELSVFYQTEAQKEEAEEGSLTEEQEEASKDVVRSLFGQSGEDNYDPILAFIIIVVTVGGTIYLLAQQGIRNEAALIYVPTVTGVAAWIFLVFIGMIPTWTVILGIVFAAAIVGFKFINSRSQIIQS